MKRKIFSTMAAVLTLLSASVISACSNDNTDEAYFRLDTDVTHVTVSAKGIGRGSMVPVTVRTNKAWRVSVDNAQENSWLHLYADEGVGDGIFRVWVDKNASFDPRSAQISFTVDGNEEPMKYTVSQEPQVPTVEIANADNGYSELAEGGQTKIVVGHNIEWTATISDVDWAVLDSCSADTVYLTLQKNEDEDRTLTLTCQGVGEYSDVISTTTIRQSSPGIYLNDHFDWMQEGKEDYYYNYPEQGIGVWTAEELSHGWTTVNPSPALYGGRGYIKLGKTNVAGDALSPKLSSIIGKVNVNVTFKAIGYVSKGGAKDDGVIRVMVVGPGTIVGRDLVDMTVGTMTGKAASFDVTVFPNSSKLENGADYDPWAQPEASFSLDIEGATKETQLLFIGGTAWGSNLKGEGQGKNRLLLDDVKVKKNV